MNRKAAPVLAFDLGMVVFGFDYNIALEKIKDKINIAPQTILKQLIENKFGMDFEKGLIGAKDFYQQFKEKYEAKLDYEEFVDVWCDIFYPHQDMIAFISQLRKKYSVYMISNINELHYEFLYKKYPEVFALFDGGILSYKVKSIKPEREIYEKLSDLAKVDFKDIIYTDDRLDLIESASRYGLVAIQYKGFDQFKASLSGHIPFK